MGTWVFLSPCYLDSVDCLLINDLFHNVWFLVPMQGCDPCRSRLDMDIEVSKGWPTPYKELPFVRKAVRPTSQCFWLFSCHGFGYPISRGDCVTHHLFSIAWAWVFVHHGVLSRLPSPARLQCRYSYPRRGSDLFTHRGCLSSSLFILKCSSVIRMLAIPVVFRGWLCHPLLITLRLVVLLARLLDTKLRQQFWFCKLFFSFDSKFSINT